MENPGFTTEDVDTARPHFEVIHSLFKQTVARVGWNRGGDRIALEFLLNEGEQTDRARHMTRADLAAKLDRLSPSAGSIDALFRLLADSCRHPSNLYTEVHWFPVRPDADGR